MFYFKPHQNKNFQSNIIINPVVQGDFAKGLVMYPQPQSLHDIEFKTVFNKQHHLSDFKGQWVIVNFWATWCPPCLVEMPSLQKLQDYFGNEDLRVIAISLDRNFDGKKLSDAMKRLQFGPIAGYYADYMTIQKQVEIKGLPTTYIINPDGLVIGHYMGDTDWISEDAKVFITSLLNPEQP